MVDNLFYNCNKLSSNYFNKLLEENVWKAFATIHAGIHHQLRIILRYKFDKDENGKHLGYHKEKWNIIVNKNFAPLVKDLFIVGIIDESLKNKILNFNTKRNTELGHINIYEKKEVSDETIKEICLDGVEIIRLLDSIIAKILFPDSKECKADILPAYQLFDGKDT